MERLKHDGILDGRVNEVLSKKEIQLRGKGHCVR